MNTHFTPYNPEFIAEQARRSRRLFAAVVLVVLDEAINAERYQAPGQGIRDITSWANSRDGQEILSLAGIGFSQRSVDGLVDFVRRNELSATSLSQKSARERY